MNDTILQIQKNNSNSILDNKNIIFDEITAINGDIDYDDLTGIITINSNGLYIIEVGNNASYF